MEQLSLRSEPWKKYIKNVRDFDAILEHSKAISSDLVGGQVFERHLSYAEQIFVKMLGHCIVLRKLLPDPKQVIQNEVWDVPSLYAVARCAIEAFDAMEYIAIHEVTNSERDFRLRLWEFHDKTRRLKMLKGIGSLNPKVEEIEAEAEALLIFLKAHEFFNTLKKDTRIKIAKCDPPAFHLSHEERCRASGINFSYYNVVMMQFSQYVHTLPFAVHQLFEFRAGTPDALNLIGLAQQYVLPFLVRSTEGICSLFPELTRVPPSRTLRAMEIWHSLAGERVPSDA
jgi:hypothetical protein